MSLNVCPAAVVAAPVEVVWALLADPIRFSEWADAQVECVEPPGPTSVGQTITLTSPALCRRWRVVFQVEQVDPVHHQLGFKAILPLGLELHEHLSCAALDATSCRVQYG